uniref:Uncharacterized protein n=1 Tax=uncultured bacterium pBF1 TaxID=1781162 RepID=A0A1C9U548_9BACT|nr:hypothetical protein [uncultured bacterium pBF1]
MVIFKKAIYILTGKNTLIVSEFDGYCEIFLDSRSHLESGNE